MRSARGSALSRTSASNLGSCHLRRPVFLNAWSDSYLWREPQRCSWGDQVPDDSGNLVGHGRNGLGSTQFATQALRYFVAEIAFYHDAKNWLPCDNALLS